MGWFVDHNPVAKLVVHSRKLLQPRVPVVPAVVETSDPANVETPVAA